MPFRIFYARSKRLFFYFILFHVGILFFTTDTPLSMSGGEGMRLGQVHAAKNRAPAQIQVTAEQLIREAQEHRDDGFEATRQQITDQDELMDYRKDKRTAFESAIRRNRYNIGAWINYAKWEITQKEYTRARSIFERAIEVEPQNPAIWLRYADMETEQTFLNHARNVYERACQILPRHEALWFKWTYLEERIGNIPGARNVFERLITWLPSITAWETYVNFEIRHQNIEGARHVYEKFIVCHNTVDTYIKYARFETKHGFPARARVVYERALVELEEDANECRFFIQFAEFEEYQKEFERARMIYKQGLERVSKISSHELFTRFSQFEKQRGSTDSIEDVIAAKNRLALEETLTKNPTDYDTWFDYIRLEEHAAARALELALEQTAAREMIQNDTETLSSSMNDLDSDSITLPSNPSVKIAATASSLQAIPESIRENIHNRVRSVYSRAVKNHPPSNTMKQLWRRYIYLWLNYAIYEELVAGNMDKAKEVFSACIGVIPHASFTFAKVWILAAELEIRRGDLPAARKILGMSLGRCPREKVFTAYIALERTLGNLDRCRTLFQKMLETMSSSPNAWISFANFELDCGLVDRCRGIFELALKNAQDTNISEEDVRKIWTAYIDMEKKFEDDEKVNALYSRFINVGFQSGSLVDIWVEWVKFVSRSGADSALSEARGIFIKADGTLKQKIDELSQANAATISQAAQSTLAQNAAKSEEKPGQVVDIKSSSAMGSLSTAVTVSLSKLIDAKEERYNLLQQWYAFESELVQFTGQDKHRNEVQQKLPQRVKKTRVISNEYGVQTGTQEYIDYIFNDDRESNQSSKKLLEFAQKWKKQKIAQANN